MLEFYIIIIKHFYSQGGKLAWSLYEHSSLCHMDRKLNTGDTQRKTIIRTHTAQQHDQYLTFVLLCKACNLYRIICLFVYSE